MAERLFPDRQRCKKCKKGLQGTPVVDGLFCSYSCAKVPRPSDDVEQAPRNCKRQVNGAWGFKTRFKYEGEVPAKWRNDPATNIYLCDYCHNLHIGHNAPVAKEETTLHRAVTSFEQLGSVIQRHRESKNITRKQVATKIKVPIIRITEIEEGRKEAKAEVLFAVVRELRLSLEIKSR
jgi:hypothetical protein